MPIAIEAPDREGVAGAKRPEAVVEFGPGGILAACLFPVEVLAAGDLEGVHLEIEGLIFGRNPCVAYFHIVDGLGGSFQRVPDSAACPVLL